MQGTYIRVGLTNRLADKTIIAELKHRKRNISFDSEVVPEKLAKELNIETLTSVLMSVISVFQCLKVCKAQQIIEVDLSPNHYLQLITSQLQSITPIDIKNFLILGKDITVNHQPDLH